MKNLRALPILCLALAALPVSAADKEVVAVVNGQPITAAEIDKRSVSDLTPLRQREFEIRSKAAMAIAFERLQIAEARRRGITVDALYQAEVTAKVPKPPEEEIERMMRALAPTLPQDPAQARNEVIEALTSQAAEEREAEFRRELLTAGKYELKLTPPRAAIPITAADPVRGRVQAPVTIVEFSDFQCPYCGRAEDIVRAVTRDYGSNVRLIYKQFPL